MAEHVIRTQHLTRDFAGVHAVDDITLDVPRGQVFGMLGPADSGKSTLVRLLLGLLEPTSGSAQVLGYDVVRGGRAIRAASGVLLPGAELHERLTAANNLELHGRMSQRPRHEWAPRLRQLLMHFGLWDRRQEVVSDWDAGSRRRLALIRALLSRPALLFLDEPTAGLDPAAAHALRRDLAGLITAEGQTVWLNTASIAEATQLCQQVGIIQAGRLVQVGGPDTLQQPVGALYRISGRNFNAGIMATLRAYPHVRGLHRGQTDTEEYLLLEINRRRDPAPFVTAIVNAGGEITGVQREVSRVEAVLRQLDAKGHDGESV